MLHWRWGTWEDPAHEGSKKPIEATLEGNHPVCPDITHVDFAAFLDQLC